MLARAPTRADPSVPTVGIVRSDALFSLMDYVHLSTLMPPHGLAYPGVTFLILDLVSVGSVVFARQTFRRSSSLPACSAARLGTAIFVLDLLESEPSSPVRHHARLGLATTVLSWFAVGVALPSKPAFRSGLPFPAYNSLQTGDFLPVLDLVLFGSLPLPQSSARPELMLLPSDFAQAGLPLPVRQKVLPDLSLPFVGRIRSGDMPLVLSFAETGPAPLLRQFICSGPCSSTSGCRLGSTTPAPDLSSSGAAAPLRNHCHAGVPLPFSGAT